MVQYENRACTRDEMLSRVSQSYIAMATNADRRKWRQIHKPVETLTLTIFGNRIAVQFDAEAGPDEPGQRVEPNVSRLNRLLQVVLLHAQMVRVSLEHLGTRKERNQFGDDEYGDSGGGGTWFWLIRMMTTIAMGKNGKVIMVMVMVMMMTTTMMLMLMVVMAITMMGWRRSQRRRRWRWWWCWCWW